MKNSSKSPMIKSRAYNQIKRYFVGKKTYNKVTQQRELVDPLSKLTDAEKLEQITRIMQEIHSELAAYRSNRKAKAKVEELRAQTGYHEKRAAKRRAGKLGYNPEQMVRHEKQKATMN